MSFFAHLWDKFGRIEAPIQMGLSFGPNLKPQGSEAREPVSDEDQKRTAQHVEHRRAVMDHLVLQANAYVFRDYGLGPILEHQSRAAPAPSELSGEIDDIVHNREPAHL